MFEPRRMHPIAAVITFLKSLKDMIIPLLVFVVFGDFDGIIQLAVSLIILVLVLISGIAQWYRFKYWVEDGELRMEFGLFVRKKRYIPFEKMQSLNVTEGILQRPFKLAAVKIETAGSKGEAEANLTAIKKSEAEELRQLMLRSKTKERYQEETQELVKEVVFEETEEKQIYKMDFSSLLLLASTSGGALVVIATVFGFFSQFADFLPFDTVVSKMENFIGNNIVLLVVLVVFIIFVAWLIAIVGAVFNYYNFTLLVDGKNLIVSKGLLEKKNVTVPLDRIQGITISENIIRKLLGYCTVQVTSAGGSLGDGESANVVILPFVKVSDVANVLGEHLVYYDFQVPLKKGPIRSWRYHFLSGFIFWLAVSAGLMFWLRNFWYIGVIIFGLFILTSYLRAKNTAYQVQEDLLVMQNGVLVKKTKLFRKKRIQSLDKNKSFFHKNKPIASIHSVIMSGLGGVGGGIRFIDEADCDAIYKWYSYTEKTQNE